MYNLSGPCCFKSSLSGQCCQKDWETLIYILKLNFCDLNLANFNVSFTANTKILNHKKNLFVVD